MATSSSATDDGSDRAAPATWSAVAVIVVAHVGALAVVALDPGLATLAALEALVVLGVVGVDVGLGGRPARSTLALVGALVGALAATRLLVALVAPLVAAVALAGTVAVAVYGLHRYELVALGLVDVDGAEGEDEGGER